MGEIAKIEKRIETPEEFVSGKGCNCCYWALVEYNKELKPLYNAMEAYAEYYYKEKVNGRD